MSITSSTSGVSLISQYTPLLHQQRNAYTNFVPSYTSTHYEEKNPVSLPPSYLSLANPTFSVEWFKESDLIGVVAKNPRLPTETWNKYCGRIFETPQLYAVLEEECDEVFKTELEIKDTIETLMNQFVNSSDVLSNKTITKFKELYNLLVPSLQKLHVLQPLLDEIGIDTTKIFTQLESSNIIDLKIKEKGTITPDMDTTVASELFSLYVVKSCVGELTAADKTEIKKLPLKLDDKTVDLFLRGTISTENIVAIQSIKLFVRQNIDPQTVSNVLGNFVKLPNKDNFDKLIQIYVTLETYGSNNQKELIRDHLQLKKIILRTIDANLEIQSLFEENKDIESFFPTEVQAYAQKRADFFFFFTAEDCDGFIDIKKNCLEFICKI